MREDEVLPSYRDMKPNQDIAIMRYFMTDYFLTES